MYSGTAQDSLPALYMLKLQSHPRAQAYASGQVKASTTRSQFSKAYVRLLIKEVQTALASAGLSSTAEHANELLQACKPCADAQALQQLMHDTVRSSKVGNDRAWRLSLYLKYVCIPLVPSSVQHAGCAWH